MHRESSPAPAVPQDLYRNALKNALELEDNPLQMSTASTSGIAATPSAAAAAAATSSSSSAAGGAGSGAGAGGGGGGGGGSAGPGASSAAAAQQQQPRLGEAMAPSTAVGFTTPALIAWREETMLSLAAEWPSAVAGDREEGSGDGGGGEGEQRSQRRATRRLVGAGAGAEAGSDRPQNLRE